MIRRDIVVLDLMLQAAVIAVAALPSLETINRGVIPDALKNLPVDFDACEEIIFVQRGSYEDPHWYANIAYFCDDENNPAYTTGAQLCKLNLKTRQITVLLETENGCIRDPKVHYDADKILFAWRKEGSPYYHLYEMDTNGDDLRQITSGPFDDYEPEYLPDGDIVFVSTRARRWVGCWMTQVGTIHRCDANGQNIRALSCNIEHDNTPAVLPNGQILYMRWEYIDRSQVEFHHLWTMNPDGSNQIIYYGNENPWGVFLDCRGIPGDDRVMGIFSPGHGIRDHYGQIAFFSSRFGPDAPQGVKQIEFNFNGKPTLADPWPLSADTILAADMYKSRILSVERQGDKYGVRILYEIQDNKHNWITQAPRPVLKRPRERIVVDRTNPGRPTGIHILVDVYNSRNMEGVKRGDIKKLLILETLPKAVNFSGGQDTLSWLGSFNLERILGTVPVDPDGSAHFELPANRPVFYVALDENDLSVKRMQSFTCVMPGETMTCLGCHETRQQSRTNKGDTSRIMAMQRPPSRIDPIAGVPEVPDFIRDIQPVLDKYCVECHNTSRREGRIALEGDMGCHWSISYFSLVMWNQVADGQNGHGNQPARSLGSSASPLLRKLEGGHYGVKADHADWLKVWAWTEAAAPFCGTYGGLRNAAQQNVRLDAFAGGSGILQKRCYGCHNPNGKGPKNRFGEGYDRDARRPHFKRPTGAYERMVLEDDPMRYYNYNVLLNATRPEKSAVLMAPLKKDAGGWGACPDVFQSTDDPDYQTLALAVQNWQTEWLKAHRFGTPNFQVNRQYIREMVRFGILPEGTSPEQVDPYKADREYWRMFIYNPEKTEIQTGLQLTAHTLVPTVEL
ncbi:MAG: hypothetical protein JXA82_06685 [Sedimentisphaerales bacterium]|nr:hypothetical protein [Sedimentisphaerales bacterium]